MLWFTLFQSTNLVSSPLFPLPTLSLLKPMSPTKLAFWHHHIILLYQQLQAAALFPALLGTLLPSLTLPYFAKSSLFLHLPPPPSRETSYLLGTHFFLEASDRKHFRQQCCSSVVEITQCLLFPKLTNNYRTASLLGKKKNLFFHKPPTTSCSPTRNPCSSTLTPCISSSSSLITYFFHLGRQEITVTWVPCLPFFQGQIYTLRASF